MRLFLDENVSQKLVIELAGLGIDAISANTNHKGLDDPTLLIEAAKLNRALVTYNASDFGLLHAAWLLWPREWQLDAIPKHSGIMLLRSERAVGPAQMALEIEKFTSSDLGRRPISNQLFAWTKNRGWHEPF